MKRQYSAPIGRCVLLEPLCLLSGSNVSPSFDYNNMSTSVLNEETSDWGYSDRRSDLMWDE